MPASARSVPDTAREAANVSLDEALLAEAVLASAMTEQLARRWRETNQAALDSSNAYVEQHGLPLAKYRIFRWQASSSVSTP